MRKPSLSYAQESTRYISPSYHNFKMLSQPLSLRRIPLPNRRDFLVSTALTATAWQAALGTHVATAANHADINYGNLNATIGDNSAGPEHRAGYNGVWQLSHRTQRRSIFVPGIAGLNLEHAITGAALKSDDEFFEPRRAPMQLTQLQPNEIQLYQSPTPLTHVESWTTFKLEGEHYLDMDFRCRMQQGSFPYGYLALFWASYINGPLDKSMYFLGTMDGRSEQWLQLCTQVHNDQSTVKHRDDELDLQFADDGRPALYKSISPMRYTRPMFYGHIDDLIWCVMFDRHSGVRFTHSPTGGGFNQERQTANPAWDFQYVIQNPDLNRDYHFRLRTVLMPRCSREDLLSQYAIWQDHLKNTKDR